MLSARGAPAFLAAVALPSGLAAFFPALVAFFSASALVLAVLPLFLPFDVYDTQGSLKTQTDPRGHATTYGYDALNRRVSMTDAYGKTTQYAYDSNNNKISETDRLGRVTRYTYL